VSKDYYAILGVDEHATQEEIRSAYRRRAKECHPDCADTGSEPFRAVHEAYKVLSDPTRRRAYDREHAGNLFSLPVRRRAQVEQMRPRRPPVEPLVTHQPVSGRQPSFFDDFFASPFDSVFDELWGGLGAWGGVPSSPRELAVEVHLSPAQASEAGTFRVQVAARVVCPTCYGEGWVGPYRCRQCDATGATVVERPLTVSYPAGIANGDVGRMSLGGVGLPGSDLVVHFRVRIR
jgi:molecular chaperone DnaJ